VKRVKPSKVESGDEITVVTTERYQVWFTETDEDGTPRIFDRNRGEVHIPDGAEVFRR